MMSMETRKKASALCVEAQVGLKLKGITNLIYLNLKLCWDYKEVEMGIDSSEAKAIKALKDAAKRRRKSEKAVRETRKN